MLTATHDMTGTFVFVDQPLQAKLLDNFCLIQRFLLILFISDPENIRKQISPTFGSQFTTFRNIEASVEE